MKSKVVFEKSIARDWSLLNAELHQVSFTKAFRDQLGWGFTEVIYEGCGGTITVYNPISEYIGGMRDFVLSKLHVDPQWLNRQIGILSRSIEACVDWSFIMQNPVSVASRSNEELLENFNRFVDYNFQIWPRFLMVLMFPIQMQGNVEEVAFKDQILGAIEARKRFENMGPLLEDISVVFGGEVCRRAVIDRKYSRFLSRLEIGLCLESGNFPGAIDDRRLDYFTISNEGISYKNISEYINNKQYSILSEDIGVDAKEFVGKVAFPGKVRGQVRIVSNKLSFSKFIDGEVLVASMTTPDYLPIMQKAIAFVTDEGGITCHAAIVARELRKPCIIGTKIATKVLKDGDMVEVDAENGVVKKI